ncbi:MAG TPA: amidohydrolase family protein [Actinomycetes bacterium]|nr:amidohydrolase family protein [Actinomycetes bacterium]
MALIDPSNSGTADVEIDAAGCLVLPGGVDPHVHVAWPYGKDVTSDTYASASAAALHGGTTTIIDFAYPRPNMSPSAYLRARRQEAMDATVEVAFHTVLTAHPDLTAQLPALLAEGSVSWKVYLTYSRRGIMSDDATLVEAMRGAARLGATICVHAENGTVADARERELAAAGDLDYSAHYRHKPWWIEAEAIQRAAFFARVTRARLHIKHLSSRQGLEMLRQARRAGTAITAETCPHYLILTEQTTTGPDGPLFLCSPPLREAVDREALWDGLMSGELAVVGADHCDFTREQKLAQAGDFRFIPNGLPGLETRLYLLYEEGVCRRGLSPSWLVGVVSTNPARIFGLYPRKGTLQPGADADIVVFDPDPRWEIEPSALHMQADWNPYTGRAVHGRVRSVVRGGEVVLAGGRVQAGPS